MAGGAVVALGRREGERKRGSPPARWWPLAVSQSCALRRHLYKQLLILRGGLAQVSNFISRRERNEITFFMWWMLLSGAEKAAPAAACGRRRRCHAPLHCNPPRARTQERERRRAFWISHRNYNLFKWPSLTLLEVPNLSPLPHAPSPPTPFFCGCCTFTFL